MKKKKVVSGGREDRAARKVYLGLHISERTHGVRFKLEARMGTGNIRSSAQKNEFVHSKILPDSATLVQSFRNTILVYNIQKLSKKTDVKWR